jgi:hypothetical protein
MLVGVLSAAAACPGSARRKISMQANTDLQMRVVVVSIDVLQEAGMKADKILGVYNYIVFNFEKM